VLFVGRTDLNEPRAHSFFSSKKEEDEQFNVTVVTEAVESDFHTLSSVLARQKCLREKVVRKLIFKILIAINHLHSGGFVHKDLNCKNVLVNSKMEVRLINMGAGLRMFALENGFMGHFHY